MIIRVITWVMCIVTWDWYSILKSILSCIVRRKLLLAMFIGSSLCFGVSLYQEEGACRTLFLRGALLFEVMSVSIVWCLFAREAAEVISV